MTTLLFPGQGSQKAGMGADVFDKFPDLVQKADDILGYSIQHMCLEDPEGKLSFTQYTQPALYVVEALMYSDYAKSNSAPNYVAGHSLGEYSALFAAGAYDFETGLRLVQKRGALMGAAEGGGMTAVIGMSADDIRAVMNEHQLDTIDIANFNSPMQVVLSGPTEDLQKLQPYLADKARMCVPLKVSAAFHSRYMGDAQKEFRTFLDDFTFQAPSIPVIANATAKPYDGADIKSNLANQITHSVLWVDSMQFLLQEGESNFVEIGPGSVLTGLQRQIQA